MMVSAAWTRCAIALGALTISAGVAAAGTASADPTVDAAVQTSCSYDQVVAALRVVDAPLAGLLDEYPQAQQRLRDFLALPVDQRRARLNANRQWQQRGDDQTRQQMIQKLGQVADTCHSY
jgi:hemophore-related protein